MAKAGKKQTDDSSPLLKRYTLPIEQIDPVVRIIRRRLGQVNLNRSMLPDFQISYVIQGQGWFEVQGQRYRLSPGSLFIQPPSQECVLISDDDRFEMVFCLFDLARHVPEVPLEQRLARETSHLYEVVFPLSLTLSAHQSHGVGSHVESLIKKLDLLKDKHDPLGRFEARIVIQQLLLIVLRQQAHEMQDQKQSRQGVHARLGDTAAFIARNLASPLTVSELARRIDLSQNHFIRLFQDWAGVTPVDYLHQQRIEKAKTLLLDCRLPIKQVAAQSGYHDPLYFSRVFRKYEGLSPKAYRQAVFLYDDDQNTEG